MIPALSYVYGLSPEEVWNLTASQLGEYRRHMDEMKKEAS